MRSLQHKTAGLAILFFLLLAPSAVPTCSSKSFRECFFPCSRPTFRFSFGPNSWNGTSASTSQTRRDKTVWNYAGGVLFETDGSLPNGVCFRVSGRVTSPEFFDNLKRIDGENGAVYRHGTETVTHFPSELRLSFLIHDQPCNPGIHQIGTRTYLTNEMISELRISYYWKHGVALRPAKQITQARVSVEPVTPYATALAAELPKRFEWFYDLLISGGGVPLTDSLVLVFRTSDGRIAVRVAARL